MTILFQVFGFSWLAISSNNGLFYSTLKDEIVDPWVLVQNGTDPLCSEPYIWLAKLKNHTEIELKTDETEFKEAFYQLESPMKRMINSLWMKGMKERIESPNFYKTSPIFYLFNFTTCLFRSTSFFRNSIFPVVSPLLLSPSPIKPFFHISLFVSLLSNNINPCWNQKT